MSDSSFEQAGAQAVAFQKMWADSLSKMMQAAVSFGSEPAPPELMRELRSGLFQALAKSWEEFMRSPQFLDSMRQWMEQAVAFRKMSNDFLGQVRNEMQATSRDDIDSVMLSVRHMEKRLLDRIEELSVQVNQMNERVTTQPPAPQPSQKKTKPRT